VSERCTFPFVIIGKQDADVSSSTTTASAAAAVNLICFPGDDVCLFPRRNTPAPGSEEKQEQENQQQLMIMTSAFNYNNKSILIMNLCHQIPDYSSSITDGIVVVALMQAKQQHQK
jgi:deoxyhypusine synthase